MRFENDSLRNAILNVIAQKEAEKVLELKKRVPSTPEHVLRNVVRAQRKFG